jgi:hypothetical protein
MCTIAWPYRYFCRNCPDLATTVTREHCALPIPERLACHTFGQHACACDTFWLGGEISLGCGAASECKSTPPSNCATNEATLFCSLTGVHIPFVRTGCGRTPSVRAGIFTPVSQVVWRLQSHQPAYRCILVSYMSGYVDSYKGGEVVLQAHARGRVVGVLVHLIAPRDLRRGDVGWIARARCRMSGAIAMNWIDVLATWVSSYCCPVRQGQSRQ